MEQKVLFTRLKKIKLKAHTHIHTPSAMPTGRKDSNYYSLRKSRSDLWFGEGERLFTVWRRRNFLLLTLSGEDRPEGCFLSWH